MTDNFEISGLFYKLGEMKLRKYLDIKKSGVNSVKPDLMVVMMNPGSSYPLDGIDDNTQPSVARPDDTQYQIMKVMSNTSLNFARILNLSDLRTPDSNELYRFLSSPESAIVKHSIFLPSRRGDIETLFEKGVPAIFGWGVHPALAPLAKMVIDTLRIETPLGMLKKNTKYSYYHPLPRIYKKRLEWVDYVTEQMTKLP